VLRNQIGRRLHRSYNLKDPTFNLRKIMPSNLDKCRSDKKLTWLSALFLALAVAERYSLKNRITLTDRIKPMMRQGRGS
jgi:hypothetical protein